MKKWKRHYANIDPNKKRIDIIQQTYESNNSKGKFRKHRLQTEVVAVIPITIDIPIYEYETEVHHFDSTAFQSDDRQFSTIQKYKAHDKNICAELCIEALKGFNTEPMEILNS
jgi:hypothetical protein